MSLENITFWRRTKSITQDQLAQLSGIPRPNLCKIERGMTDPTLSTLNRIARGLNITLEQLFSKPSSFDFDRHQCDKIARSIVSGERKMDPTSNDLADSCARLMTFKLKAHSAVGFERVKRLMPDDGIGRNRLMAQYNPALIKFILSRTKKFLK